MTAAGARVGAVGRPGGSVPLNGSGRPSAGVLGTALPTRQRNNGFVALAVALVVGLAAIGAYLYASAGAKTPVVMVVHRVEAGQVVARSDLTTVPVAGGIVAVAGSRLDTVVGQRAAVTLLPDMLVQRSMLTAGQPLPAGQAQVGVAVHSGQLPADGLSPGDVVQVVALPSRDGTGIDAAARVLADHALVFTSRPDPAVNGGTLVTVTVPESVSTAVAAASGAGAVALVKVAS